MEDLTLKELNTIMALIDCKVNTLDKQDLLYEELDIIWHKLNIMCCKLAKIERAGIDEQ